MRTRQFLILPLALASFGLANPENGTGGKPDAAPPLPPPIAGKDYRLVFAENFDGPAGSRPSDERWTNWRPGPRKDGFNVPEACRLDGKGKLIITVTRKDGRIEAGGIQTHGKFQATHGYYECRAKLLNAPGAWSAFWLQSPTIGKPVGDPVNAGVELDVIEFFPGHKRIGKQARHTAHWDGYDKAHHKTSHVQKEIPGLAAEFRTFAMKWDEEGYVFYIDGEETGHLTEIPISNRPQYMILSCETAKWSGDIGTAKLPAAFAVDHVRVWQSPAQIEADLRRKTGKAAQGK